MEEENERILEFAKQQQRREEERMEKKKQQEEGMAALQQKVCAYPSKFLLRYTIFQILNQCSRLIREGSQVKNLIKLATLLNKLNSKFKGAMSRYSCNFIKS